MTNYATLLFPDYETAVAAAKSLGFWADPEPIYEMVPTGETKTWYHYKDQDGGEYTYDYPPASEELEEDGDLTPADPFTTEKPVMERRQVGMTEGRLRPAGQTIREDGTAFSWAIDEIGLDPVVVQGEYDEEGAELVPPKRLQGYVVNACGDLPEEAMAYVIPYGSAGRVFSGTSPEPHTLEPLTGNYVQAVASGS